MNRRNWKTAIWGIALGAALVLGGCGMDDPEDLSTGRALKSGLGLRGTPDNWLTANITPTANTINSVAYGNNVFVAVGSDSFLAVSSDGINWDSYPPPPAFLNGGATQNMRVHFGGGCFIATASSSGQKAWAISKNGTDWDSIGDPSTNFNAKGFTYGNFGGKDYYLISGSSGRIAYSNTPQIPGTGIWTIQDQTDTTFSGSGSATFINALAFGDGIFVAGGGGGHAAYASDPTNYWTGGTTAEGIFGSTGFINALVFGNDIFVAVGGMDAGPGQAAISKDGEEWVESSALPISGHAKINTLCYGEVDGVFLLGDGDGDAAYSDDGANWTAISDTTFNSSSLSIEGSAYGAGVFVLVGSSGHIAYSKP